MERRSDMDIATTAMDVTGIMALKNRLVDSLSSGERRLPSSLVRLLKNRNASSR